MMAHNNTNNDRFDKPPLSSMANNEAPLLGLKLKYAPPEDDLSYEETLDTLAVMIAQDAGPYRTRDYLCRRRKRPQPENCPEVSEGESVDPACREKMCEWSYRCCDHFGIPREACAFAFSFLDRFMDHFNCNRTAFKLAAMSCLNIATKMLHVRQISIASLSELSRGEFQPRHLADMEKIILQTLDFRMNPPSTQAFLSRLRVLLPTMEGFVVDDVYQRAVFYAELSVYDYYFVVESCYETAIACYINAFRDVEEACIAEAYIEELLDSTNRILCVDFDSIAVEKAQKRLSYLYSCSEQCLHEESLQKTNLCERSSDDSSDKADINYTNSPVGVIPKPRVAFN